MVDYKAAIKILIEIHEDDEALEEMAEVTFGHAAQSQGEIANVVRYLMWKRDGKVL